MSSINVTIRSKGLALNSKHRARWPIRIIKQMSLGKWRKVCHTAFWSSRCLFSLNSKETCHYRCRKHYQKFFRGHVEEVLMEELKLNSSSATQKIEACNIGLGKRKKILCTITGQMRDPWPYQWRLTTKPSTEFIQMFRYSYPCILVSTIISCF